METEVREVLNKLKCGFFKTILTFSFSHQGFRNMKRRLIFFFSTVCGLGGDIASGIWSVSTD